MSRASGPKFLTAALAGVGDRTSKEVRRALKRARDDGGFNVSPLLEAVRLARRVAGGRPDSRRTRDALRRLSHEIHNRWPTDHQIGERALRAVVDDILSNTRAPFPRTEAEALRMIEDRVTGADQDGLRRLGRVVRAHPRTPSPREVQTGQTARRQRAPTGQPLKGTRDMLEYLRTVGTGVRSTALRDALKAGQIIGAALDDSGAWTAHPESVKTWARERRNSSALD